MSDEEEMVACSLGDDYYKGEYFITQDMDSSCQGDYLVPRSQVERWEQAMADYGQMQTEIDQVMSEQRERVMALRRERRGPKSPMAEFIERVYSQRVIDALQAPATFRRAADEGDVPWLVTDAKIDRDEEERGL